MSSFICLFTTSVARCFLSKDAMTWKHKGNVNFFGPKFELQHVQLKCIALRIMMPEQRALQHRWHQNQASGYKEWQLALFYPLSTNTYHTSPRHTVWIGGSNLALCMSLLWDCSGTWPLTPATQICSWKEWSSARAQKLWPRKKKREVKASPSVVLAESQGKQFQNICQERDAGRLSSLLGRFMAKVYLSLPTDNPSNLNHRSHTHIIQDKVIGIP